MSSIWIWYSFKGQDIAAAARIHRVLAQYRIAEPINFTHLRFTVAMHFSLVVQELLHHIRVPYAPNEPSDMLAGLTATRQPLVRNFCHLHETTTKPVVIVVILVPFKFKRSRRTSIVFIRTNKTSPVMR
eukprot:6181082-Pleurochrysis_carterae.AAC.2